MLRFELEMLDSSDEPEKSCDSIVVPLIEQKFNEEAPKVHTLKVFGEMHKPGKLETRHTSSFAFECKFDESLCGTSMHSKVIEFPFSVLRKTVKSVLF